MGDVASVSVNKQSTITDEEVIYCCKEAALKTNFSYNFDESNYTYGTITYTFN